MSYYPTLDEDLARARVILAKGKPSPDDIAYLPESLRAQALAGGTIFGADTYAAYKLLESFVEVIEAIGPDVAKTVLRARRLTHRKIL